MLVAVVSVLMVGGGVDSGPLLATHACAAVTAVSSHASAADSGGGGALWANALDWNDGASGVMGMLVGGGACGGLLG